MAGFNKFNTFAFDIGRKIDDLRATGDTLKIYLSNIAPNASTMTVKADLTEIAAGIGYTAGGEDTQNDYTQSGATSSCTGIDVVWTAAGGSIGPFRYVVLYDDTPISPADPLIGWWDYGSSITLNSGETFTVDFGANMFTIA